MSILKRDLVVGLLVVVFVPILCNWIVLTSSRNYFVVAEGPKEWLTFFGSYAGSVIAALTSFVILYRNQKDNLNMHLENIRQTQKINELSSFHQKILDIQKDLAMRFGKYDLSLMINMSKVSNIDKSQMKDDLYRLQTIQEKYKALKNSADLLYRSESQYQCPCFWRDYEILMDLSINLISKYIYNITLYIGNKVSHEDFTKEIEKMAYQVEKLDEYSKDAMESARYFVQKMLEARDEQQRTLYN